MLIIYIYASFTYISQSSTVPFEILFHFHFENDLCYLVVITMDNYINYQPLWSNIVAQDAFLLVHLTKILFENFAIKHYKLCTIPISSYQGITLWSASPFRRLLCCLVPCTSTVYQIYNWLVYFCFMWYR